jgi:hypothetical protein
LPTFLDELFSPCLIKLSTPPPRPSFGHIFWAPAYHAPQTLQYWVPKQVDDRMGSASDFNIGKRDKPFKPKSALNSPELASTEEFLVVRAKRRPVVLIAPPDPALATIPSQGRRVAHNLGPVALSFSAVNKAGYSRFHPTFLERVRLLEYPQFLFLPAGGPLEVDSLIRFDELQSVAEANLEATGYTLNDDLIAILKSQLCFLLTGLAGQAFQDWAAELKK